MAMRYSQLGSSGVNVSCFALGTQTFGEQNDETQAFAQLDAAMACGINLIDTAEMYPFPAKPETAGLTEQIIGNWLKARNCRDRVVIATKVTGRSNMAWLGGEGNRLTRQRIESAVEGSLKRLQTDTIDLYQLHWPDRYTNNFGRLGYNPDPDPDFIPLEEQLEALKRLVDAGKIRYIGVSNETPWGLMSFLKISELRDWPRVVSIQNPYSLLNRSFEVGLGEVVLRESCALLAYSPLAFGLLTGKYHDNPSSEYRITRFASASKRFAKQRALDAAQQYCDLARRYEMKPAHMALAFNLSRPFVTSTILGASSVAQLEDNFQALETDLPEELLKEIEALHDDNPYPCP